MLAPFISWVEKVRKRSRSVKKIALITPDNVRACKAESAEQVFIATYNLIAAMINKKIAGDLERRRSSSICCAMFGVFDRRAFEAVIQDLEKHWHVKLNTHRHDSDVWVIRYK